MQVYKIAVIARDGIGPEVLAEGIKALDTVAELDGSFLPQGLRAGHSLRL